MRSLRTCLAAGGLGLALLACQGAQPPAPTAAPPVAPAPVPVVAPAAVTPAPAPAATAFVYDALGLRDPFEPFLKLEVKKTAREQFVPRTPLQQYSVEELRLVGIVWGDGGRSSALVEDPRGKGYVVGVGTYLGDRGGKIVRIQLDRLAVEERIVDLFGEENLNVVTLTLRKSEGEVNR